MTDTTLTLRHRLRYTRLRDVLRGRFDASLYWRQTIAMSELPQELADAIGQVVGRTRLWRREKVDVAMELVAHFQDGLVAGRSPQELLKSFGDPTTAAMLIRRAKKRGRPLIWHIWHYGWITALALVVVYIAAGIWMATGKPTIKTDYLAIINQQAISAPKADRAWPLYRDALLELAGKPSDANSRLNEIVSHKPGDKDWVSTEKFLSQHAESIAKLRKAGTRPTLGFVPAMSPADFSVRDRELFGMTVTPQQVEAAKNETIQNRWIISTLLPHMQWLRTTAYLLSADARQAAITGDSAAALDDVLALLGLSSQAQETPFMICSLVAEAVQEQARAVIHDILAQKPDLWSDDQIRDLAHQLAASPIDWRRGFEGERAGFYDTVQRLYTDNGNGNGRLALKANNEQSLFALLDSVSTGRPAGASTFSNVIAAMFTLPAANIVVASRKEMTAQFDKITDQALTKLNMPYWERMHALSLADEMKSLTDGPIARYRYLFVSLLTPAYDTILNKAVVSDSERHGVFLGLALELYHREHHKWPTSLDELSPRWSPAVPVDPITGKPLHYKVVNDRPIVYSVGTDGDDDGGRIPLDDNGQPDVHRATPLCNPAADGDWVLWTTAHRRVLGR